LYREKAAHGHAIFSEVVPGTDFSKILIRAAVREVLKRKKQIEYMLEM